MHSRSNSAAACALAFIIICFNWPVSAQLVRQREADRIAMLERISPSVVCVMSPDGQGGGSGVLISSDGFAISNFHVTDGAGPFMKCGLNDGKLYDAVIVGIDPTGDIALIKLTGRDDFPAAIQGNSDQVQIGDEVVALGNPFLLADDFTPTVTYGIVSGIHRYQYPAGTFLEYTDCIQIDASINPGNSGGPLFDIRGNWIGINGRASFEKRGRVNSGAAYAISIRQVQLFIEHLKCGLIADHGIADFTVETLPDGRVVVSQVSEVSEAWRRGLRPQNEVVTFADRLLTSANDFQNILGIFPEGTRLPMTWRGRDGMHEATIRLRPLHAFDKAPPTRGKRRPSDPNDPESPPDHPEADGEPVVSVPDSLKAMFEDKDGYANYYFNRIRREAMLDKIRKARIPESHSGTWVLNGDTGSGPGARQFELVVGDAGAGF
ncbi:MAG: trypsin-like peptidase domain-containing protein, partial [Planctomycetaceae bacterium]